MMNLDEFFERFCDELADADINKLAPSTDFKKLEEWDSLASLMILAMIEDEFEVLVTSEDIMKTTSIEDLYNLVINKLK